MRYDAHEVYFYHVTFYKNEEYYRIHIHYNAYAINKWVFQ